MRMQPVVSLEDAKRMLAAGEAEAARHHWAVAIAVLNSSGILVALHAMDGVRPGNPQIAIDKARTAALTQRSSKVWEDWVVKDKRTSLLAMDLLPLQGGLPIIVDGQCVGSVGVSGVASHQDEQVGEAAIKAVFANAVYVRPGD